jgi:hypothetical protein
VKAHLLFRDADFYPEQVGLPAHAPDLVRDLGLDTLFAAMAAGDTFLDEVARKVVLNSLTDPAAVGYRQRALADGLAQSEALRQIYDLAGQALVEKKRGSWYFWHASPSSIVSNCVSTLEMLIGKLAKLRAIADENAPGFTSEAFTGFCAMLAAELDDEYFDLMRGHLSRLEFRKGVLVSARLGRGAKSLDLTVRAPWRPETWWNRLTSADGASHTVTVPDRDEGGAKEVGELRDRAVNEVANALAQACDHIAAFLAAVRAEVGFYVGCLNLHEQLVARGEPVCFPEPAEVGSLAATAEGLYEVGLALRREEQVVGNALAADDAALIVITGANSGGKSTFCRALGIAQLMAGAGVFAPAASMRLALTPGVFTHFQREEDASMAHGKLDEELVRMRHVAEAITPGSLLLMNESFASTNEREGAEIAEPVLKALTEAGVRMVIVTHSFELARRLEPGTADAAGAVFLRAERLSDGTRTYRMVPGPALSTSFGADIYQQVFGVPVSTGAGGSR